MPDDSRPPNLQVLTCQVFITKLLFYYILLLTLQGDVKHAFTIFNQPVQKLSKTDVYLTVNQLI